MGDTCIYWRVSSLCFLAGNAAFNGQKYDEAVLHYTAALDAKTVDAEFNAVLVLQPRNSAVGSLQVSIMPTTCEHVRVQGLLHNTAVSFSPSSAAYGETSKAAQQGDS